MKLRFIRFFDFGKKSG